MSEGPLTGLVVLDLTRVLSGPHCTRMLCDLGASVVKVEPPAGDMTRFAHPRINGLSSYFTQQNAGKRNISLDMSRPEGVELLLGLVEHCDVLVENFRPGVMRRMGLDYDVVAQRNPRTIYASISGYGQSGPWIHRRAYAPVVGAETGFTKAQGDARQRTTGTLAYTNDPHSNADLYTALECSSGILAALYQRERTGRGDWIDVSMAQTMLYINEHAHDLLWDGPVDPAWVRSFGTGDYPALTAGNGETVVISGHPADNGNFYRFAEAIGRPDLGEDPRFVDVPARMAHLHELIELIGEWAATMATPLDIEEALSEYEIATGTLRSFREVCDTDWALERRATVEVSDRGAGTVRIPNAPWRFAGSDIELRGEPRYRGEDNREVLTEFLGLGDAELDRLESAGIVSSRLPAGHPTSPSPSS